MKVEASVFKIAKNWLGANSEEVRSFKNYLRRLNPRFARRAGDFRAFCYSDAPSPVSVMVAVEGRMSEDYAELINLQIRSDGRVLCKQRSSGHECNEDCCF
jgi:hypothetical protein